MGKSLEKNAEEILTLIASVEAKIGAAFDVIRHERDHYRNALQGAIPLGITANGARTVLEYGDMIRRGEV